MKKLITHFSFIAVATIFLLTLFSTIAAAQIRLPKLISDGMVLQRNTALKIWGWASPNENITVAFLKKTYTSIADEQGNWVIKIPAQKAGGPFTMLLKGKNEITINDILIGDVWICSGQSNMELPMERVKYTYPDEVATANNSMIRQFLVPDKYDFKQPQQDLSDGAWLSVNKKNIGEFSAIAYFFAKELFTKNQVPVGLINTSLGGSPAEAWISEAALKQFPAYYAEAQKFKDNQLIKQIEARDQYISTLWYNFSTEWDEGHKQNWKDPSYNDATWKQMNIPGYWADTDAGSFNGIVWFRKDIEVPASMLGKSVKLELGRIVDADSVFINGQFLGWTSYQYPPRRYILPSNLLKEGKNSIVIRVVNNSGKGGFVTEKKYELTTNTDTIPLTGFWKYKTGITMPPLPSQTFIRWKPLGLYNAMIAPLTNYAVTGAIWYQGESNAGRPNDYKELMQTLIEDWRSKWNQKNMPFLFVQLANFSEAKPTPEESFWAALRQQQLNTLTVPNTAMAVTMDVGEWNDIHPENKKEVGHRLALQARKNVYGEKSLIASGPLFQSSKVEGNKTILTFTNTGTGLTTKNNNELKQFAIAGADKKYSWAKAIIKGNTVIVWKDEITNPVFVRYAWADNPEGANLYNKEGLPASPFTTDN